MRIQIEQVSAKQPTAVGMTLAGLLGALHSDTRKGSEIEGALPTMLGEHRIRCCSWGPVAT